MHWTVWVKLKMDCQLFNKMWEQEYTNVHVPTKSRFSKCQICWEYKGCIKAMPNECMKQAIQ